MELAARRLKRIPSDGVKWLHSNYPSAAHRDPSFGPPRERMATQAPSTANGDAGVNAKVEPATRTDPATRRGSGAGIAK